MSNFKVVSIDETNYWNESIGKFGCRVIANYAYDMEERTYCCESTPSRWMEYLGSNLEFSGEVSEDIRNEAYEYVQSNDNDDNCHYRHCMDVDGMEGRIMEADSIDDMREYWSMGM
jgi:hypothetical protein